MIPPHLPNPPGAPPNYHLAREIMTRPPMQHAALARFPHATQLVMLMLNKNQHARITAQAALDMSWFTIVPPPAKLSIGVSQCLQHYAQSSELKRCVYLLVAAQADLPALGWIARLHTHLDTRNTGLVPVDDFKPTLLQAGIKE